MRWQDIDFDKCAWTLPSERTKAKRSHVVPLPSAALELIKRLPRLSYSTDDSSPKIPSEYVFTTNGKSPISGFGWIKARIDSEVSEEMPLWTLHDLRRTVATGLVGLGIPVDHVARLLNHAKSGVTSRFYDQHSYFLEKRAALEAWEAHLLKIVS
jgi:integrase